MPACLKLLEEKNISTTGLEPENWEEFSERPVDVVITLSSEAHKLEMPVFLNTALKGHWELINTSTEDQLEDVYNEIETRVQKLVAIDYNEITAEKLEQELAKIT